jgi:hypothetical protein
VLWLTLVATGIIGAAPARSADVLLFPYFDSNGENGVYLSWSTDGRQFYPVNNGQPVFTPPSWEGQGLTRDPSISYSDGLYHMVWTSNWGGNVFGHASSSDLMNWSTPQIIQPFATGSEQPNNVWAPEIFHDPVADDFKIVWSSTLNSELQDGDGSGDPHGNDHRMFYISTTDFQSFTSPQLLFQDEGYSVIDAFVAYDDRQNELAGDDRWVMALKREQGVAQGGKNVRLAFSDVNIAPSSFGDTTAPVAGPGSSIRPWEDAEGPSLVYWQDEWLLYWDSYTTGHYSMASSPDLQTWTDQTASLSFPVAHPRHGSAFVANTSNIAWDIVFPGDLNGDGTLNYVDWQTFSQYHLADLSGLAAMEQARRGDLDGDGDNDFDDFRLFKQSYLSINGPESFAQLVSRVPEPSTWLLMAIGLVEFVALRSNSSKFREI